MAVRGESTRLQMHKRVRIQTVHQRNRRSNTLRNLKTRKNKLATTICELLVPATSENNLVGPSRPHRRTRDRACTHTLRRAQTNRTGKRKHRARYVNIPLKLKLARPGHVEIGIHDLEVAPRNRSPTTDPDTIRLVRHITTLGTVVFGKKFHL